NGIVGAFKIKTKAAVFCFHPVFELTFYTKVVFTTGTMPARIWGVPLHNVGWCIPGLPYFFYGSINRCFYRNFYWFFHCNVFLVSKLHYKDATGFGNLSVVIATTLGVDYDKKTICIFTC